MDTWEIVADGINQGKKLPELSPRETMVMMFSLMERSGTDVPWYEDRHGQEQVEESQVLMEKLTEHFRM